MVILHSSNSKKVNAGLLDLEKTKELVKMEKTILEMQEKLKDGFFVEFTSTNDNLRFLLEKSDEFKLLDEHIARIQKESGMVRIINLNWIVEISITSGGR